MFTNAPPGPTIKESTSKLPAARPVTGTPLLSVTEMQCSSAGDFLGLQSYLRKRL
jgi:hypothetical protein